MLENKIAILIPTFNGGSLLAESVASAAKARLPADSYEIVVSDNASDDGSIETLPSIDAQGVSITIHRNAQNLGRVENWNCALRLAREMGFCYAIILMVGDLVRDASIIALRDRMIRTGAALGLASYEVIDETKLPLRLARRFIWNAEPNTGISSDRFLAQTLSTGIVAFGPLGANLYDIRAAHLHFDPNDPTHTDQYATISFLREARRPVVYLDQPITQWRERTMRFHSTMDSRQRFKNDLALVERACAEIGITPDRKKIRSTFILRAFFHSRVNFSTASTLSRSFNSYSTRISLTWTLRLLFRQFVRGTPWRIES
jgi:hypothetical protein